MNSYIIEYSLDDIPEDILDCGNVRYKVKLLYKINYLVLVEVFTGSVYKYHVVNHITRMKKYLFFTKQPLPNSKYVDIAERILKIRTILEDSAINNNYGVVDENSGNAHKDSRKVSDERATTKENGCFRKINYLIATEKTSIVYLLLYMFHKVLAEMRKRSKTQCSYSFESSA